jgi:hypothetical protein
MHGDSRPPRHRPSRAPLIAALIAAAALACGDRDADRRNDADDARTDAPPPIDAIVADSVQFSLDTLAELAAGVPLGGWRAEHPDDRVEAFAPDLAEAPNDRWCARAQSTSVMRATTVTRSAYFYAPRRAGDQASRKTDRGGSVDDCRLGFLWTDFADTSPTRVDQLAVDARRVIAHTLGEGDPTVELDWTGSTGWHGTFHWRLGRISFITGAAPGRAAGAAEPGRVFVGAAGDMSGLRFDVRPGGTPRPRSSG